MLLNHMRGVKLIGLESSHHKKVVPEFTAFSVELRS
jgi:hypothetical protein